MAFMYNSLLEPQWPPTYEEMSTGTWKIEYKASVEIDKLQLRNSTSDSLQEKKLIIGEKARTKQYPKITKEPRQTVNDKVLKRWLKIWLKNFPLTTYPQIWLKKDECGWIRLLKTLWWTHKKNVKMNLLNLKRKLMPIWR